MIANILSRLSRWLTPSTILRTFSVYDTTIKEWTSILDLANRWGFAQMTALAVRELEKMEMPDVDRIVLYHKYSIDRMILVPRYAALCARDRSISVEEGEKLGMETALMIGHARERARSKMSGGPAAMHERFDDAHVAQLVTDLFVPKKTKVSQPKDAKVGEEIQPSGEFVFSDRQFARGVG